LEDAAAAIDYLATLEDIDAHSVVVIGHSAGGHLATWAAGRGKLDAGTPGAGPVVEIAGVISLAGIVDLGAAVFDNVGNGQVIDFMGGSPHEYAERYAVADPLSQIPIPAIVCCVHARDDNLVPFAESATYVAAAQAAGQDARLLEVVGDHSSVADTAAPTWPTVIRLLEDLMSAT
jgi:acetyl esterase/lipase